MSVPSIVFLDAATVDAGDVSFDSLESLGQLTLHHHTAPDQVQGRCEGAEILLTNKVVLDGDLIANCPELRYIVIAATGTNNVDLEAARKRDLPVSNVRGYSTDSVAQHTIALLLNLATSMPRYCAEPGAWSRSRTFARLDYPMVELAGLTLGIAGLGEIGRRVASLGQALGMKIVALQRRGATTSGPIPRLEPEAFFATCDAVSLHCPLTPENHHLINRSTLDRMKPSAFLINTGRGPLVDESALLEALREGRIGGAGLDVLSVEPPAPDHPLLTAGLPQLLITPHTAWATTQSRRRLLEGVCENIREFLGGGPIANQVA